jgi:hypothetical protein
MNFPKYNLGDELMIKYGSGKKVIKIKGIQEHGSNQPFLYETAEKHHFKEEDVLAIKTKEGWQEATDV